MLQSPRLKDNAKAIGVDQSVSNNALFEHKCIQNTMKLYNHAGYCDGQKQSQISNEPNTSQETKC